MVIELLKEKDAAGKIFCAPSSQEAEFSPVWFVPAQGRICGAPAGNFDAVMVRGRQGGTLVSGRMEYWGTNDMDV